MNTFLIWLIPTVRARRLYKRHTIFIKIWRSPLSSYTNAGESPVAVTLTSSNLNVNEDGVIRFVVILRIEYHLWTSNADAPKKLGLAPKNCVRSHKNLCPVTHKIVFYIWHVTNNHKSHICDCYTQTQMEWLQTYFFAMLPPDMAWIAIRVLGQCQKHGALLADDTAKWGFAWFFLLTLFRARTSPLPPITITNTHTQTHTVSVKSILHFPVLTASTSLKHIRFSLGRNGRNVAAMAVGGGGGAELMR